ncbi:CpxP family protein [soil metagenome]
MKKIIFAVVAVLSLSLGAIFVFAQRGGGEFGRGFGRHEGFMFGRIFKQLDLSDEQKTQIKQIMDTQKSKVQPIFEAMKENRQKLQDLTKDGNFDETQVKTLADEQGSLSALLIVEKERTKSQIFQILTAEQREKAKQMQKEMKNKMNERRQRRDKNPQNPTE